MKKELSYKQVKVCDLSNTNIEQMYYLMQENYDFVELGRFKSDLYKKDLVGILIDSDNFIQGFTTFSLNPCEYENSDFNILFSGDTVISSSYTGSQELAKGWCKTAGYFLAKNPHKKLFWYLMSKGYRTYLYLPFFFNNYYPSISKEYSSEYYRIANRVSSYLFGNNWHPQEGVIKFDSSLGQIKKVHVEKSFSKSNRHVKFFISKNPGFINGEELVCVTEISVDNLKRYAKDLVKSSYDYYRKKLEK